MLLMLLATTEDLAAGARRAAAPSEGLIARMAEGSTAALAELYAQTSTAVYGFALSILKNGPDAEDVMQDTYLTLFGSASSYRAQGKPMAWILTITRNLALMKLRGARREAPAPLPEQAAPGFEAASVDKLVLQAALAILPDEERQIVVLHCAAGQKHREIAGLLNLPLGTVLSKYRRALLKLQKNLEEAI